MPNGTRLKKTSRVSHLSEASPPKTGTPISTTNAAERMVLAVSTRTTTGGWFRIDSPRECR